MLVILVRLKTMQLIQNGLQPYSGATPLFSMRTGSVASSQSCCSGDDDAWYTGALKQPKEGSLAFVKTFFLINNPISGHICILSSCLLTFTGFFRITFSLEIIIKLEKISFKRQTGSWLKSSASLLTVPSH